MNMDDVLQTFIIESRELLEQMEDALLRIELCPDDTDTLNAIFRAAHTIKGSAGLFGLEHVVRFTHHAESVLDKVRNKQIHVSADLIALFLAVRDYLGRLIDRIADGSEPDAELLRTGDELVARLQTYLGEMPSAPAPQKTVPVSPAVASEPSADTGQSDKWHLSLRFGRDLLRSGLDPLAVIHYLETFGEIVHVVVLDDAVPPLSALDPESCYLGFELSYRSDADKADIEAAFEFVREDAVIRILPPHSKLSEYRRLIEELPEEQLQLGEILVRCGTLTQTELDEFLLRQTAPRLADMPPMPLGEMLIEQHVVQPQVVSAALEKQNQVKEQSKHTEGSVIRVNSDKLDEHINLIGELIIASASVLSQRTRVPELSESIARLSHLVEEVRDSALKLRMVQIGATFNKFQRVVHDMSAELQKDIRLVISGAETELDKTVVEKIGDPLTHLVRNSLDHGIEGADLRIARGKPAQGTIRLNAYHDSGNIVIEVSDDGGGLNRARILEKAIERGIIKSDQVLSDREICNLIFEAGFSTCETVNNLSGRGVGMDVVRRNITELRGYVEIDSTEGVGTTMRVRLPLTLAIIDGFLIGVEASVFVVPLEMVVECIQLSTDEVAAAQGRNHLNLRGAVLPLIFLKDLFSIAAPVTRESGEEDFMARGDPGSETMTGSVTLTEEGIAALASDPELAFILNPVKRKNVVVVQYAGHHVGLVVDTLLGEYQTVIRPLGFVFGGLQGLSGFTILGSGHVALILDVPGLVQRVISQDQRSYSGPSTLSPGVISDLISAGSAK
jgi:two-component system chemotaxis sensor kinase CheA